MTSAELATLMYPHASSFLGSYKDSAANSVKAFWYYGAYGQTEPEPPVDWTVTGIECRISSVADIDAPVTHGSDNRQDFSVRLVAHSGSNLTNLQKLAKTIHRKFNTDKPQFIEVNERLDILAQYILNIRS